MELGRQGSSVKVKYGSQSGIDSARRSMHEPPSSISLSSAKRVSAAIDAEVAEVIGQEELPLRSAFAWRAASDDRPTPDPSQLALPDQAERPSHLDDSEQEGPSRVGQRVPVAWRSLPGRGGRPRGEERYPFSSLEPVLTREDGLAEGPSFLIPEADNPNSKLSIGRRQNPGKTFVSRAVPGGVLVWRTR
jgi:hypothetical protein